MNAIQRIVLFSGAIAIAYVSWNVPWTLYPVNTRREVITKYADIWSRPSKEHVHYWKDREAVELNNFEVDKTIYAIRLLTATALTLTLYHAARSR